MSFLEYMVSHLQYFDGSQMFGLFRVILWALVNLISSLCSAAEGIYNHIFSLVGVIYNKMIMRTVGIETASLLIPETENWHE